MDFSREDNKISRISPYFVASTIILAAVVAFFVFVKDPGGIVALRWLFVIFLVSFIMRKFLIIDALPLWDYGFGLSYGLGIALSFFLAFIISSLKILPFDNTVCFLSVALLGIVPVIINSFRENGKMKWTSNEFARFLFGFAIFSIVYVFAFWVIGFNPLIDSGTENYMDYGFMQAIYRQKLLAPYDIWFSNKKLNYYYLGQASATFMSRLALTTPEYGYNLSLATFWGMVFVMTGEIAYGVIAIIINTTEVNVENLPFRNVFGDVTHINIFEYLGKYEKKFVCALSVFVAGFYSAFAGNGHWLIFGVIKPLLNILKTGSVGEDSYWFPSGTVYISTDLGDIDNGKNEFPAYSAILGDLHAHVINVIFVLPLVALLIDYIFSKDSKRKWLQVILCGILLGLYKGSNFWDFAIYYVITGGVIVFTELGRRGVNISTIRDILIKAIVVTTLSYITILPFTLGFNKMASAVHFAKNHSPIYKMVVLWGVPIIITVSLVIFLYMGKGRIYTFKQGEKSGLLAFILCTIGLVVTPELLYVEDIYGEGFARFNTMFKLTYQAFILFGIIIGIAAGIFMINYFVTSHGLFAVIAIVVINLLLVAYTPHSIKDWFADVTKIEDRIGISAVAGHWDDEYYFDMAAAKLINEDSRNVVNIIEGQGSSYTHADSVSVFTGACTIVGWYVHEWMWRDDSRIVESRANEVMMFYEYGDLDYNRAIIDKYDIDYIYVGPSEYENYDVNLLGIESLGVTIWNESIDNHSCMLIKVK